MDPIKEAFSPPERNSSKMQEFGSLLRQQFSINESYRQAKELEWLESLRQYKGLYDPDVKIPSGNSRVYPKLTRSKCNMVLSRLHEMLFPEIDKNWEILHTPDPKIAHETVQKIIQSMIQQDPETGEVIIPTIDELRTAINTYAKETCEKMSIVIDDQLTEMLYPEETKKVLASGLKFGTGIMKGPLINKRSKRRWEPDVSGAFNEVSEFEDVPYLEFVRIWDWYPDMSTTEKDQMDGCFERHVMTKHDLRKLMKREDFYGDIIRGYMEEHPDGDYVAKNWEGQLQLIEIEAGSAKQTTVSGATTPMGTNRKMGKKYEVLEYWGFVDGQDMEACGIPVDDVGLEYEANVWILGHQPIKAVLFDRASDIYKVFYYEKDETSIFGEGLARIMRHSQIAISSAARMVLDNAACVAGPQVEVNWSLMTPGTDINDFYPRKIWYREGRGIEAQYPAVRDIQFESHIPDLISIIREFKQFGDEETTLPTWMIGQTMPNETAQGVSMRLSNITISVKDVVRNFDAFTEQVIRDLYAWNMDFNPRTDIKGDYNVKARGVSSLVMKEVRMQALTQMAGTMTEEDWLYVPRREFLHERMKSHDLQITLRTEEEAQKLAALMQDQRAKELAYAQMEADIAETKAKTMGALSKAKKSNVDANIQSQTGPEITPQNDPRITEAELALQDAKLRDQEAATRMKEEKHRFEMNEKSTKNRIDIAQKTAKTATDIENKNAQVSADIKNKKAVTAHGMKIKEKLANKPAPKQKGK